jgi:hypothetical protein
MTLLPVNAGLPAFAETDDRPPPIDSIGGGRPIMGILVAPRHYKIKRRNNNEENKK